MFECLAGGTVMTNERTTSGWRCGRLQRVDGGMWVLSRVGSGVGLSKRLGLRVGVLLNGSGDGFLTLHWDFLSFFFLPVG